VVVGGAIATAGARVVTRGAEPEEEHPATSELASASATAAAPAVRVERRDPVITR
jgi:hypothetical protein